MNNVTRKDATIVNTDDTFPGSFEVILSAPTKDRDGDTLLPEEWKQPLPDHITFDSDHGMSVATTVGSGMPSLDAAGNLTVAGTYSSLARAQEVRTLVNEGHIRTTSVAFMTETSKQKDGKPSKVRELLNGAFVAVPSNREALVLSSKTFPTPADVFGKAGARNSKTDAEHIQAIHDHALALGATPRGPSDDTGAAVGASGGKSVKDAQPTPAPAPAPSPTPAPAPSPAPPAPAPAPAPAPVLTPTVPEPAPVTGPVEITPDAVVVRSPQVASVAEKDALDLDLKYRAFLIEAAAAATFTD